MADWWLNEGPKYIIFLLWMTINVILFATTYVNYNTDKKYFYLRKYLKYAICSRRVRRLMDKNITFHRYIGYMICLATAIHVYAHCFNFLYFLVSYKAGDPLLNTLNQLNTSLNPIRFSNADLTTEVLKTAPGITGIIITLALILMYASSTEVIRRSYFEIFWYAHHLFVIFFIGLCIHAVIGVIKVQVNLDTHDPDYCYNKRPWGPPNNLNCSIPIFKRTSTPQVWKWVIGPIVLYIFERIVRFVRSKQKVVISKVINHPSKVLEIQMQKRGFQSVAGQYVFINCPSIARFEWHPFTLTSAPGDDYFSVHDVFLYEVAICIGAGIGVTPFASILKSLWYKQRQSDAGPSKTKKVYFFWICPDSNAFEWFAELLKSLEREMLSHDLGDFLEYNIYLTRGLSDKQTKHIMLRETDSEAVDAITGLQQKTHYGRPRWDQIFSDLASTHSGSDLGVFFCGPKALSSVLHKECNKNTSANTRFFYNKENF
ncbi:Cytochrome b-245 heavy chain [Trichoplax sp. H2]|nr:Cytochrome b-245 heavy chain [Trichoplax sp. H2]|eukprot:RDD45865.1 Cytochrome b-245 heavy chain [Trichoplax sp. H2]